MKIAMIGQKNIPSREGRHRSSCRRTVNQISEKWV